MGQNGIIAGQTGAAESTSEIKLSKFLTPDGTTNNEPALSALRLSFLQPLMNQFTTIGSPVFKFNVKDNKGRYRFDKGFNWDLFVSLAGEGQVALDFRNHNSSNNYGINLNNINATLRPGRTTGNGVAAHITKDGLSNLKIMGRGKDGNSLIGLIVGNVRNSNLFSAITASQTTMKFAVGSADNFPLNSTTSIADNENQANYVVAIGSEKILITRSNKNSDGTTDVTSCVRGWAGTTAATASSGATVIMQGVTYKDFRKADVNKLEISDWNTGIQWAAFDNYINQYSDIMIDQCKTGIHLTNYNNSYTNSGEKNYLNGFTFAGNTVAIRFDVVSQNVNINNSSFDFCGTVIELTAASGFNMTNFLLCWFENLSCIVDATINTDLNKRISFNFDKPTFVPTSNGGGADVAIDHNGFTTLSSSLTNSATTIALTSTAVLPVGDDVCLEINDGTNLEYVILTSGTTTITRGARGSTARAWAAGVTVYTPRFPKVDRLNAQSAGRSSLYKDYYKGAIILSINDLYCAGMVNDPYVNNGLALYHARHDVRVTDFSAEIPIPQLPHRSYNVAPNSNLSHSLMPTNGTNLEVTDIPGWTKASSTIAVTPTAGILGVLDNGANRFYDKAQAVPAYNNFAIKLTCSNPSGNYFLFSDPIEAKKDKNFSSRVLLKGGISTGNIRLAQDVYFYRKIVVTPSPISMITRSGNVATVTTATPHGLVSNMWVKVYGASSSDYNRYAPIVVTSSTVFTYTIDSNTTALSPATALSGDMLRYEPEGLAPCNTLNRGPTAGNANIQYINPGDTNNWSNQTETRNYYIGMPMYNVLNTDIPLDCTSIRVLYRISEMAVTDDIWIGGFLNWWQ